MRSKSRLIILDGDDTLWPTQTLYDDAKAKFAQIVIAGSGRRLDAIRLLDEIDAERVATHGFSRQRLGDSMVAAYDLMCRQSGEAPQESVQRQLIDIAGAVFDQRTTLYPEVDYSLRRLGHRYTLVLLTKGDPDVQEQRIAETGISKHVHHVKVVADKGELEYRQVLDEFRGQKENTWAIGNSARSDINPALRLGIRGILIPRKSWRFEEAILEPGDVTFAADLQEAVDIIARRDGWADSRGE